MCVYICSIVLTLCDNCKHYSYTNSILYFLCCESWQKEWHQTVENCIKEFHVIYTSIEKWMLNKDDDMERNILGSHNVHSGSFYNVISGLKNWFMNQLMEDTNTQQLVMWAHKTFAAWSKLLHPVLSDGCMIKRGTQTDRLQCAIIETRNSLVATMLFSIIWKESRS